MDVLQNTEKLKTLGQEFGREAAVRNDEVNEKGRDPA
jgi:hypothetical protein